MKVLKFSAKWCKPCAALTPTLEKLSEETGIKVEHIDIEEDVNLALVREHQIRSVPTLVLIKGDNVLGTKTGNISYGSLKNWVEQSV